MALREFVRVLVTCLLLSIISAHDAFNGLSDVTIQTFHPRGFRASIKDVDWLALFAIQGFTQRGVEIRGETASAIGESDNDKLWVVDLPHVALKVGDEIKFLAFAAVNTSGFVTDNLEYKVKELEPFVPLKQSSSVSTNTLSPCQPSVTRVRHGDVCAGQTIFEEHFDYLREDVWQVEQYLPSHHPELPFVSYQPLAVSVKDGNLRIVPSLQQAQPGFSQKNTSLYTELDFGDGCTKDQDDSCFIKAEDSHTIVPPVISGRIISKSAFAFTYGTISIRAKLPQGDWIYPELLLEPLIKKFTYERRNSGMLKIACARGNKELNKGVTQYGNKVLYSGPVLDARCPNNLLKTKISDKSWGDSFHVYSVKWTNESLVFSVDGEEYATVEPEPSKGLRSKLPKLCLGTAHAESRMKPFEDYFSITLGLAVGGHSEFPDATVSKDNHAKPWRNRESKATIDFWKDRAAWHSTWQQPELLVDYVKVVAL